MSALLYDGRKILALMEDRGLSMNRLAKAAGISVVAVHNLVHEKTNKVSLKSLKGIADALGVPLQALLRDATVHAADELQAVYQSLSPTNRTAILGAAQALLNSQKKK